MLGIYNLAVSNGWLPVDVFCELAPFDEKTVKHLRNKGEWLNGVITKVLNKKIWVNVWEVNTWFTRNGLGY